MKLESKPAANLALFIVAIVIGLLIIWLARDFSHGNANAQAGFLLGCMLFGLGIIALAVGESRTVELDERRRMIVLVIKRRLGGSRRIEIPSSNIRKIGICLMGDKTDGSEYFDLVVTLGSGKEIYLFGGCVFEGRMSRESMDNLRGHFERSLGLYGQEVG